MIKTLKSKFVKDSGLLVFSSIIAQALQLITVFIAARIISQSDLGDYTIFLSNVAIMASIGILQYEISLVNLDESKLSVGIFSSVIILFLLSSLYGTIFYLFGYDFSLYLSLYIFFSLFINMMILLLTRYKHFKLMFSLHLSSAFFMPIFMIICFIFNLQINISDLLLFQVCVVVVSSIAYGYLTLKFVNFMLPNNLLQNIQMFLSDKKDFALISAPGNFINSVAYNIPVILIGNFFGKEMSAQFFMAIRFSSFIQLLGGILYKVYHSRLAHYVRINDKKAALIAYKKIKKVLFALGFLSTALLIVVAPIIVPIVLGEGWNNTVLFTQIYAPLTGVMLFIAPLSVSYFVFEQHKKNFINSVIFLVITLISFITGIIINNLLIGLSLFVTLNILRYIFIYFQINSMMKEWCKSI